MFGNNYSIRKILEIIEKNKPEQKLTIKTNVGFNALLNNRCQIVVPKKVETFISIIAHSDYLPPGTFCEIVIVSEKKIIFPSELGFKNDAIHCFEQDEFEKHIKYIFEKWFN
jgi:hypothetical protein